MEEFSYTEVVSRLRTAYKSGKTKSLEWRKGQLQKVIDMLTNHEDELITALHQDLKKPKTEAMIMEINYAKNEAIYMQNNLANWLKPVKVSRTLVDVMNDCHIRHEPYGVALIVGAWNYPVQLIMCPLLGAICGGNCAVLKPSEMSPMSGKLLEKLLAQYLDNDCFSLINGGIPETTALLKENFDLIFYTGNNIVAKIIMRAAAEHLTPVVLELGGKSPVFVDSGCNLSVVARRIMWGKCANTGQTCIAPDYVMCTAKVQDELIKHIKEALRDFYGDDPKTTPDFGRIISLRHFDRLNALIDPERVACGGQTDRDELYIAPTVLKDIKLSDDIMSNEIFGPILPILPVQSVDDAVKIINQIDDPLALYIFSNNKKIVNQLVNSTNSGGICINDTVVQASPATLPFGGVGKSGIGNYHGQFSFETFSHQRSCLHKDLRMESVNSVRYPPYTDKKYGWISWLLRRNQKNPSLLSLLPFVLIGTLMAYTVKTMSLMH